jgi:uncharacterized DUF497 family protein
MEWDLAKARDNEKKHGIRFTDIEQVFYDPYAITTEDYSADGEQRLLTLGTDGFDRVLVVAYTHRSGDIRIISARKANPSEVKTYEERK